MSLVPLYEVSTEGNVEAAKILLDYCADLHDDVVRGILYFGLIESTNDSGWQIHGMTALHAAAYYGHSDVVKLFIERGASINKLDKKGRTPFFLACQGGHTETARYLLDVLQGDEADKLNMASNDGKTPLRKASTRGKLEIVKLLLERIDSTSAINAKDSTLQQTPLHLAAYNGHKDVVEILLDAGADTRSRDKSGRTPVDMCSQGWAKSSAENAEATLILLLDKDCEAVTDLSGLLCTAAVKGNTKVIEKLIGLGADPNLKDEHGWTPLLLARQYQNKEATDILSRNDPVIKTKPSRWSSSITTVKISEDGLGIEYSGKGKPSPILRLFAARVYWILTMKQRHGLV